MVSYLCFTLSSCPWRRQYWRSLCLSSHDSHGKSTVTVLLFENCEFVATSLRSLERQTAFLNPPCRLHLIHLLTAPLLYCVRACVCVYVCVRVCSLNTCRCVFKRYSHKRKSFFLHSLSLASFTLRFAQRHTHAHTHTARTYTNTTCDHTSAKISLLFVPHTCGLVCVACVSPGW